MLATLLPRRDLNGMFEMVDFIACLQTVVVDRSILLVQFLFRPQKLCFDTRCLLQRGIKMAYSRSFTELQLYNVSM